MRTVAYVSSAKGNARAMLEAFAKNAPGVELVPGTTFIAGAAAIFWGVDRETLPVWRKVIETKTPYWYVDNGYFKSKWQGGDHFRVTRDAPQHSGEGESSGERWKALGIEIKPWRDDGLHILVACQSDFWHERHGDGSAGQFAHRVTSELQEHTLRPIITRGKPIQGHKEPPLSEHFKDCWAVVTHSSMVAAEAVLNGIPAFMLSDSALRSVSLRGVEQIEAPYRPSGRERWAGVLADNQWTLDEIKAGDAWRALGG
jgi:hypothetical protein